MNGQNPLTAPLTMAKQFGEQGNLTLQNIGNRFTQTMSKGLDFLSGGGAAPSGITPQSLSPGNLIKTISQAEEVFIPSGLPKPAQAIMKAQQPAPQEQQPTNKVTETQPPTSEKATTGMGYQKVLKRRGI